MKPPIAPFVHPKLPLAARLGLCRGARPSRWPFSASRRFVPQGQQEISQTRSVWFIVQSKSVLKGRRNPSSFQDGQIYRPRYQPLRSWLISIASLRDSASFATTKIQTPFAPFVHPKLPLAGAGARPPTGTWLGSAPVHRQFCRRRGDESLTNNLGRNI